MPVPSALLVKQDKNRSLRQFPEKLSTFDVPLSFSFLSKRKAGHSNLSQHRVVQTWRRRHGQSEIDLSIQFNEVIFEPVLFWGAEIS